MIRSDGMVWVISPKGRKDLRDIEVMAAGKAARKRAGRGTLGHWAEEDRGHDALETILAQNLIRVPELVPLRHQRMAASAWYVVSTSPSTGRYSRRAIFSPGEGTSRKYQLPL